MSPESIEPQDIILVGATGDLARRKLLPALYKLHAAGLLPEESALIGLARSQLDHEDFRGLARRAVEESGEQVREEVWQRFAARLTFVRLDDEGYEHLAQCSVAKQRLIYLAVPPSSFREVIGSLVDAGLDRGARLVIEKPFGRDLASDKELNSALHEAFDESQIFRIDHYLGKETIQNILVLRFGNAVFERLWDRDSIDHIEITVAESMGIEGRGSFYEEVGALRDVVQNHVLQVLALLTMEPPISLDADAIRDEKVKLLKAVQPFEPDAVVRAQYKSGGIGGQPVVAYRDEPGVDPASETETFVALRAEIDNWRWAGVPIYLRTGKRLAARMTQVEVAFRNVPKCFFEGTAVRSATPNHLTLTIQPEERIAFSFVVKKPGSSVDVKPVHMDFSYADAFDQPAEEAYERLIYDAMRGDHTLFVREDGVERAWSLVQPLLERPPKLCFYPAGTWGPPEADGLVGSEKWHLT